MTERSTDGDLLPPLAALADERARALHDEIVRFLASTDAIGYRHGDLLVHVGALFALAAELLAEDSVPREHRVRLVGAVVAVLTPADFLPEPLLGPIGYEDDLLVLALVLYRLHEERPHLVAGRWRHETPIDVLLREILNRGEEMVGDALWSRLREWVGG